ncbi:ABC transporter ATP-binding protein [Acuticoccus sediminis]|uniref:ABC transporter ATP-binding protein n=1 Tax=Acuticoccus sediminis TaxID=2184697 RepID=A0A8B2P0B0_9HYPH|nr:ABC transporter ATP-binding protein [Acuticoccus sediminis]RAI01697.1 ABC transporter ATP-binding protein [Acuticoccus sediminis]
MSQPFLNLDRVTKRFGGLKAVGGDDGLSLSVTEGHLLGLIGPNGAGKSTTFNLISGVLKPDSGTIRLAGAPLPATKPDRIAAMGIARAFQQPRAFPSLSVRENVMIAPDNPGEHIWAALTGRWRETDRGLADEAAALLSVVGLADRVDAPVSTLSGGELRMLEVARQLMRHPRLLLLDEPTAGVDPKLQKRLGALLGELKQGGTTIIIVEHNLHFLLGIADHVAVLVRGELLAEGPPDAIRRDERVIAAYLGANHAA